MEIESLRLFIERASSQECAKILTHQISFLNFNRRGNIQDNGINYTVFTSVNSFSDPERLVKDLLEKLKEDLCEFEKIVEFKWHDNEKWIQTIPISQVQNCQRFLKSWSYAQSEAKEYEKKSNGFMVDLRFKIGEEERSLVLITLKKPFESEKVNVRKFVVKGGEFVQKTEKDLTLDLTVDIMIIDDAIYILNHKADRFFWSDTYILFQAKQIAEKINEKNIFSNSETLNKMASNTKSGRKLLKVRLELFDSPDLIPTLRDLKIQFNEEGKIICEPDCLNEALNVLSDRLLMNPCDKQLLDVTSSTLRKIS